MKELSYLDDSYPCKVIYDGQKYPSLTNAFETAKFPIEERAAFLLCSPAVAVRLGKKSNMIRGAWENCKDSVYLGLLLSKFKNKTLAGLPKAETNLEEPFLSIRDKI